MWGSTWLLRNCEPPWAGQWDEGIWQGHSYDLHPKTYAWRTPDGIPRLKASLALWVALEKCFDHHEIIYLSEAMHDWQNLCFQDYFKSVNEYNSEVCRIWSLFKFCKKDLTEIGLLEKTFSTFHAFSMFLQQQYRERKLTKFSKLITTLLLTEKNKSLDKELSISLHWCTSTPIAWSEH